MRYSAEGFPEKAKEYCEKLLLLQSPDPKKLNLVGWQQLRFGKNIEEALELAEKALEINPEDYTALHRKGWALYKLGRYSEALEYMQESEDIRVRKNLYDKEFYLHLDSLKIVIAGQKAN
jgi:tetratricopeptide (TPR) repeat protein